MGVRHPFSWRERARSFRYAFKGIRTLFECEHNARIHLAAAVVAIALGVIFSISLTEWAIIVVCIGVVFSAEAINSAVEALADKVSPQYDPLIGKAKDLAAAAVLFVALAALFVGLLIFLPHLILIFL